MKINGMTVPDAIVRAYQEYGFAKPLETAISTRTSDDWYAILFKDRGELYAVDFVVDFEGNWEVNNDYIGPFESVEAFLTERLTRSFI